MPLDFSAYFSSLEEETKEQYALAVKARAKGYDPDKGVEIALTKDLAARAEQLVATSMFSALASCGVAERIRELEQEYGKNDDRVALIISKEIAKNSFVKFSTLQEAVDAGIRVGLAYLTGGIVTAPLEGISDIEIKKNDDGSSFLSVGFAGPIRSAGGTASAMAALLADYVRLAVGLDRFNPRAEELERTAVEVEDYFSRVTKKQYTPTRDETKFIVKHVPIELTGTPTEQLEVSTHKDLERIPTNKIRGGMCLVLLDGLPLKASKLLKKIKKYGAEFGLAHWGWLKEYITLQQSLHASKEKTEEEYVSSTTFLDNIVAGRPVLAHPGRWGAFRLRYGRSRTGGLAVQSLHPATMAITQDYMALGTQLRTEYPGKATVSTPCDSIEPPVVLLKDGSVIRVETREEAEKLRPSVEKILFLGDILVPFGEFLENGKKLLPAGYCEEWWAVEEETQELKRQEPSFFSRPYRIPTAAQAISFSKKGCPLHPFFTHPWGYLSVEELRKLKEAVAGGGDCLDISVKSLLERLWVPHTLVDSMIVPDREHLAVLRFLLEPEVSTGDTALAALQRSHTFPIRDKAPIFFGLRMGRPEKADYRLMKGSPQVLFPCGMLEGGRLRNLSITAQRKTFFADTIQYRCQSCERMMPYPTCPLCDVEGILLTFCSVCGREVSGDVHCKRPTIHHARKPLPMYALVKRAEELTNIRLPALLKSPKGVIGKDRAVERFEKGLFRGKYGLFVNKDGTIRYDSTDISLTHFKPSEAGTSVEKLKELGYVRDIHGRELTSEDQVLLLYPQDVILPDPDRGNSAATYLFNVTRFLDECLERLYGLPAYYSLNSSAELVGQLIIGLAPHTSGGIIGRIIGFSKARATFAHPYWHAAKRRNCDGDEDSVLLLLDGLLNFSRGYLPDRRGTRSMDCCLVLSTVLNPDEVDSESWNVDIGSGYPLELYRKSLQYAAPGDVAIRTAGQAIREEDSFNFSFTHDTTSILDGPMTSYYLFFTNMVEKVRAQMELGKKIVAVDEDAMAELILEGHFIKDIRGNFRAFSRQTFRCVDCNTKYRRVPLQGRCRAPGCKGTLLLTVTEGGIKKYLNVCEDLAQEYSVSPYLHQQILLLRKNLQSMFGKDSRQIKLGAFTS